jgi:[ribosomal protein S18]-alanine N-acetyltransferase
MADHAESIVSDLQFRPFSRTDALTAMSWRYPAPYSAYNLDPQDPKILAALLRPEYNYHAIVHEDEMVGFFCLGPDARVSGGKYDESALDLGFGLRPDLIGRGQGRSYFAAVLRYIEAQTPGRSLRATVVGWNQRVIRLCQRAGFRVLGHFISQRDQEEYVILLKVAEFRSSNAAAESP